MSAADETSEILIQDNRSAKRIKSALESCNEDLDENNNTFQESAQEPSHYKKDLMSSAGPKSGSKKSFCHDNESSNDDEEMKEQVASSDSSRLHMGNINTFGLDDQSI